MNNHKEKREELFSLLPKDGQSAERAEAIYQSLAGVLSSSKLLPDGTRHGEVITAVIALSASVIDYSERMIRSPSAVAQEGEHLREFVNMLGMMLDKRIVVQGDR